MIAIHQETSAQGAQTRVVDPRVSKGAILTSTPATEAPQPEDPVPVAALPEVPLRPSVSESVLDNLSAWTVVAAAISLLYLVWVTLEILSKYVGILPKVGS
jgi:hypothetical protein